MLSMTGFGCGESAVDGTKVSVEISSFNRKQLDIRVKLPKEFSRLEVDFRRRVSEKVTRGAIQIKVDLCLDSSAEIPIHVDLELAKKLYRELKHIQVELGLDETIFLRDLLEIPNISIVSIMEESWENLSTIAINVLHKALDELIATKEQEGIHLKNDIQARWRDLLRLRDIIKTHASKVPENYRDKLNERILVLTDQVELDQERIAKEVAFFADRSDISEEITRLSAHLEHMENLFESSEPVGRKLDFLIQELFREVNTIGSKCCDIEIAKAVIDFKTDLERVREQVQNIE